MGLPDNEENTGSVENSKFKDGVNRNARLIVRNIPFKATEQALKEHFSKYGTVEEVKLLKKPDGKLVGCGFVHYTHVPMANKAILETNKKPFMDRPIYVSWAVPKHKYGENNQNNEFKKDTVKVSEEDSPPIKREKSNPKEDKNKLRVNRNARLIVRNISFKATEDTLKEHFAPYGDILEVKLLKKPDGKLVGCAFVHFKNVPMAKKAILSTNLKPFLGRPISVDWAVAKDKYMQHVVNQQLEMQEDVKKEESDSDDDNDPPINITNDDLKQEIKSEDESDESDDSDNEKDDDDDDDEDDEEGESDDDKASVDNEEESDENEQDSEESEDEDEDEEMDEDEDADDDHKDNVRDESKRVKLNDAEDGCTVFITNIPFSVDDYLLKDFAEKTGPLKYALVCIDKLTEHSKGTGFVKFVNKEDADTFLSLPSNQLRLDGQSMIVKPALKRENLQKGNKKEAKDNRNLYLVKEGVIVAGTKAAVGVSASDMSKRLALERSKTQMLKNLNRFVSRYRLVVSNLPRGCDDARLRAACASGAGRRAVITEARVMRDLRAPSGDDGRAPSKGYGFVMFTRHEDALTCLRKLNNNPDIFDKNNRPIVSFSIEDRTALNARKKRLEKSIANNPLAQKAATENQGKRNRKRKMKMPPDESYVKKGRFDNKKIESGNQNSDFNNKNKDFNNKKNDFNNKKRDFNNKKNDFNNKKKEFNNKNNNKGGGKFDNQQRNEDEAEFAGLTAKAGSQHKMRSNFKLKAQADIHRQNVKLEKKKSQRTIRLKKAAKERIKLPKQKINKNKNVSRKRNKHRNRTVFD